VSVTTDLLKEFEPYVSSWELIPSDAGRFEVRVGDELVYSKVETGRHTDSDELRPLIKAKLK
jgi:selT/selW/selH-like putative selenoprotein